MVGGRTRLRKAARQPKETDRPLRRGDGDYYGLAYLGKKTARFAGGFSYLKPCYSPLPNRRDHHPARRGGASVVVSAGPAGAGLAAGSVGGFVEAAGAAAAGWGSARKLTFSRTVERRRAALSAS